MVEPLIRSAGRPRVSPRTCVSSNPNKQSRQVAGSAAPGAPRRAADLTRVPPGWIGKAMAVLRHARSTGRSFAGDELATWIVESDLRMNRRWLADGHAAAGANRMSASELGGDRSGCQRVHVSAILSSAFAGAGPHHLR